MFRTYLEVVDVVNRPRPDGCANPRLCVDLMREFLRREAVWARRYDAQDGLPFLDIANLIVPGATFADDHVDSIKAYTHSMGEMACLKNALNWFGVRETYPERIQGLALPEPYEPILRLFESGGRFAVEHRVFIDVNEFGVHAGMVQNGNLDVPLVDLPE